MSQVPPAPPKPPIPGECCERGCENCVWVFYYEAQRRHEAALQALAAAPVQPSLSAHNLRKPP